MLSGEIENLVLSGIQKYPPMSQVDKFIVGSDWHSKVTQISQ